MAFRSTDPRKKARPFCLSTKPRGRRLAEAFVNATRMMPVDVEIFSDYVGMVATLNKLEKNAMKGITLISSNFRKLLSPQSLFFSNSSHRKFSLASNNKKMMKHLENFMNRFRSANLKIIGVQVNKSLKNGEAVLLVNEAYREKAESFVNAIGRMPMDVDLFNDQVELMENIDTHKKNIMKIYESVQYIEKELKVIREQMKSDEMEECSAATTEGSGGRAETGEGRK
ncbi:hypothetical protein SLEP1_g15984 [Rubroshorea leprosula]|uniref:Uncharacterized protein n=2 Tax=Rubroshorea leprosula TaxID=152421 RepID=A0AAV5IYE5_9ROSI|nr:hypothetical protein SLEP1_g15984 [Rubroshorea leprosula]